MRRFLATVPSPRLTAILCGAVLAAGALAWLLHAPRPAILPLPADAPPSRHIAGSRSASAPPLDLTGNDPAPTSATGSPDQNLLSERRCLALAERDPIEAREFALDHHLLETNRGLLETLTGQWAAHDFKAAHEWLRKQEPGDWRDQLMARIAYVGSQSDPAAAAQIVSKEIPPGPRQAEAALSVLHQWTQRDPESAAAWVAAFPPSDLRTRAQAEIEGLRHYRSFTATNPQPAKSAQ